MKFDQKISSLLDAGKISYEQAEVLRRSLQGAGASGKLNFIISYLLKSLSDQLPQSRRWPLIGICPRMAVAQTRKQFKMLQNH